MSIDVYRKIKDCEGIIFKIANKYSNYYNMSDLYQAGCIGVIKASKKYKNNFDNKFSTYAYKYILGEIIDCIKKDRNIIISDEAYEVYKRYVKLKELLYSKNEKVPSFSEVCSYMKIDEKYMLNIIESVSFAKSIEEDECICNNCFVDNRNDIDMEILIKNELLKLDDFDRNLIDYRYYQGYTQCETAQIMGISQVKVSRHEKLILSKIKDNIAN